MKHFVLVLLCLCAMAVATRAIRCNAKGVCKGSGSPEVGTCCGNCHSCTFEGCCHCSFTNPNKHCPIPGSRSPQYLGCVAKWHSLTRVKNALATPSESTHTYHTGMLATRGFMESQGLSSTQYQEASSSQTSGSEASLSMTVGGDFFVKAETTMAVSSKYEEMKGQKTGSSDTRSRSSTSNISTAFNRWTETSHKFVVKPKRTYQMLQAVIECRDGTAKFFTSDIWLKDVTPRRRPRSVEPQQHFGNTQSKPQKA